MKRTHRTVLLVAVVCTALVGALPAQAFEEPAVNLGFTSFLDGGPPAGPGFYAQQYIQYYDADAFHLGDRSVLEVPNAQGTLVRPDVEGWISLSQVIYQSDQALPGGGKWGLDLIVPYVSLDTDPENLVIKNNDDGVGDILIGPYLQWDPIMCERGPFFMHRVELQCIFPTGRYDEDFELNPGNNVFSFNPYWAATVWLHPKWTLSWRVHYLWSSENTSPSVRLYGGADDVQAGQAVHGNFASAIEVWPKRLHIGVNGYYLKQFEASEVNGQADPGTAEEVFALGPGAALHLSQDHHVFLNAYIETGAENRPEGERYNLRYVHHF